ncbi:MAG: hypothetical protein ABIS07_17310 [Dokdonella sp.]
MAKLSVVEAAAAKSGAPSYKDLTVELSNLQSNVHALADVFLQLAALFATIKGGSPRAAELADLGRYVADDFGNLADCLQEDARCVVDRAQGVEA